MGEAIDQLGDQFAEPFRVSICRDTNHSVVSLHGALDLAGAPHLDLLFEQLLDDGYQQITVDLSQLTFLGAAGLGVFVRVDQGLRGLGGRLLLTKPTSLARRVLTLAGLDATLTIQ
jgi:anti-sigma B factor antagonist